jgi:hypothetical protein
MKTLIWGVIAFLAMFIAYSAQAQEFYYPIGKAETKDTGLFCVTTEEVSTLAKLFGINWVAEPYSMTLMGDGDRILIEFTGSCATSAKVVR